MSSFEERIEILEQAGLDQLLDFFFSNTISWTPYVINSIRKDIKENIAYKSNEDFNNFFVLINNIADKLKKSSQSTR